MKGSTKVAYKHRSLDYGWGFWLALGLLYDRLSAPGWLWGATGVVAVIYVALVIFDRLAADYREPLWRP